MSDKTLIIGGCGYIGSHLYKFLLDKGLNTETVDLELFGNYTNPKNKKINYNNLTKKYLKKYNNIILLAGYSSVKMCEGKMSETFNNNVVNFVNLLNNIEDQKFIYASSSSVYGKTKNLIVDENYDRYIPSTFYDLSKKEIDYYAHLSSKNFYGLRFGTVNGYSPNLRVDLMINKMYKSALESRKIIVSNPDFYRPILGIKDLGRAVYQILKNKPKPGIYNLASFNATILQIAKAVVKKTKAGLVIDAPSKSYNFSINSEKFEEEFNFKFKDSSETIIDDLALNYKKAHQSERI